MDGGKLLLRVGAQARHCRHKHQARTQQYDDQDQPEWITQHISDAASE
jgi:hypothetical protein